MQWEYFDKMVIFSDTEEGMLSGDDRPASDLQAPGADSTRSMSGPWRA